MAFLYNAIPFELFTVICVAMIPFGIYGAQETERRTPGHPGKWLWLGRYVNDSSVNYMLQEAADIVVPFVLLAFFIGLFITAYIAGKKGYANLEKMKDIPILLIAIAVCIVVIFVLNRM